MFIVTDHKKAKSPIGAACLTQPTLWAPVLLLLAGCSTVGIEQQRLFGIHHERRFTRCRVAIYAVDDRVDVAVRALDIEDNAIEAAFVE